ncbi:DoxX family protein [Nocardia sp. NPDC051463]|uniref:DoxX family protein n=1 Tax=Nocardia sp. NPDC051463 TaxID=3154845 RepID=UPI00344DB91B
MSTAYAAATILAAAWVGYSAAAVFGRAGWVIAALTESGVPESWWNWLGAAKAMGAIGLASGLFVPLIGIMAALGLVLYFGGAVGTVLRARLYSHVPFPLLYMAPVIGATALGFAA